MARASRSSKKQPAFDPSELTDLIYTPAVGRGVGSHLFGKEEEFPAPVDQPTDPFVHLATVEKSAVSTVDESVMATVDDLEMATVARNEAPTVDRYHAATVGMSAKGVIPWVTEHGNLVPQGRVKRISAARDVINAAEEAVYETLWTAELVGGGAHDERDAWRVVQAGYDYLAKRTQLSKRTIQRIVEKLIDKDFLAIERPADIYLRSSTVYRVFGPQTVLDRHKEKGRLHVAKLGPGFAYVRRLSETRLQ